MQGVIRVEKLYKCIYVCKDIVTWSPTERREIRYFN